MEGQETEIKVLSGEQIGKRLDFLTRLERSMKDPEVQDFMKRFGRTAANMGITLTDFVPGFGEFFSGGADALKLLDPFARKYLGFSTDLSPDVSKKTAIGSELLEIPSAGLMPTHIIETVLQLKKDWGPMREGFGVLVSHLRGEMTDYRANRVTIDEAMGVFGVEAPNIT